MFYALGMRIGDPVFLLDIDGQRVVFLDDRELGVFAEENRSPHLRAESVHPFTDVVRRNKETGSFRAKLAYEIVNASGLLKRTLHVPASFPLDIADHFREKSVHLTVVQEIYPERRIKTPEEIGVIQNAIERTKKAFEWIEDVLRVSSIEGDRIIYRKEPLTSEFLRKVIDRMLFDDGLFNAEGSIISCGKDAAIPHHPGKGPIRPHQPIIVDLFPRDRETGYFADMTRTYLKGTPSLTLKRMFDAVRAAKEAAIAAVRPGALAKDVHETCVRIFSELGFKTGKGAGFIHSAGHGLGLEIHEKPNLGLSDERLEEGNVITVEPGLYYPEHGGVRIEDVVVITEGWARNLTNYPEEPFIP